jgi:hypothetical protein
MEPGRKETIDPVDCLRIRMGADLKKLVVINHANGTF